MFVVTVDGYSGPWDTLDIAMFDAERIRRAWPGRKIIVCQVVEKFDAKPSGDGWITGFSWRK